MEQLVSYHGDPAVKQKYQDRFARHREMDAVIQGTGYDNGRGCFVGCTLEKYDHSQFPVELGWPEWLAYLADRIFEGLPKEDAPQFGTDLLDAVPVGVDLEPLRHKLAIARMDRNIDLQVALLGKHGSEVDAAISQVIASLRLVRQCHEAELGRNACDFAAARSAARSAASAAAAAPRSAAASAAESAARSAASAAWSAARSAASAAWSAAESAARSAASAAAAESAESAAYQTERDTLLKLLREMA